MSALASWARALGGYVAGHQVLAPGPGHGPHDHSLSIRAAPDAPDGFVTHSFAGDDWRRCRDHVRARLGLQSERPKREAAHRPAVDNTDHIARALDIWSTSQAPRGTSVETYLVGRRLPLPRNAGDVIRFAKACAFRLDDDTMVRIPTMIALLRDSVTDTPCGIHRTGLKADGSGKAELPGGAKRMLGRARGACIKLSPNDDVTSGLGLAEGIENGLAVLAAGWAPVWAAGSAGAIAGFPEVAGVESLTIFADADNAGLRAARDCQARWRAARRECRIVVPRRDRADWADIRLEAAA